MLTDDKIRAIRERAQYTPIYLSGAEIDELATRLLSADAKVKGLEEALREIETSAVKWEFYSIANRARTALQEQSK
jgi:hypothetical protein